MASPQVGSTQNFTANTTTSNGTRTKTLRLTENKRRYRARRKEYVSDLESRLAAAREQGVQASKEVQLAAQQVAIRNTRLRDLLSLAGFDADEIECWESGPVGVDGGCSGDDTNVCSQRRLMSAVEEKARFCATVLASSPCRHEGSKCSAADGDLAAPSRQITGGSTCTGWGQPGIHGDSKTLGSAKDPNTSRCDRSPADPRTITAHTPPITIANLITTVPEHSPVPEATEKRSCGTSTCSTSNAGKEIPISIPILPTCKLLTRLAENPAADITQVPAPDLITTTDIPNPNEEQPFQDSGASDKGTIECRKAYDMLIQYATTEEKMDTIARALETGCTKSGNGKGGCAVRSEVILQALDSVCR